MRDVVGQLVHEQVGHIARRRTQEAGQRHTLGAEAEGVLRAFRGEVCGAPSHPQAVGKCPEQRARRGIGSEPASASATIAQYPQVLVHRTCPIQ